MLFKCNTTLICCWSSLDLNCLWTILPLVLYELSFFEPHCPQFIDSSFNHISLPHSWSECYLVSFSLSNILPLAAPFFKECQHVLMSFLSRILQTRSMFFLFDNLSCSGINSHISKIMFIQSLIVEMKSERCQA